MGIEAVTNIADLVPTNPAPNDPKSQGDDHVRNLKVALLNAFAGYLGAISVTGTDGGAANAYTVTPTTAQALPAYGTRMAVAFSPIAANTGACTLNVAGLGAKALNSVSGAALVANDLVVGTVYAAIYNGTEFRLSSITKNYADQLAFSTAVPAQAGNAGKFLKTSGAVASWAYPGISVVSATVTTNTTLAGSYLIVPVLMSAMGQSITLPAANTLTVGGPLYVIDNSKGSYPAGIRDNTGTLLMAVAAGGVAMVNLKDASTVAGVWSLNGTGLEPGLITIDSTFSSTYSTTTLAPFVALDANTSIHFLSLASGFAAFVVDNVGKVLTTPVVVDSTASSLPRAIFAISATQAILFYGVSSTSHSAVVLTVSGTSPSLTLSVGTSATTTVSMSPAWNAEDSVSGPRVAQMSTTTYLVSNSSGGTLNALAVVVSGATVSIGSAAAMTLPSTPVGYTLTYALSASSALVLYCVSTSGSSPYTLYGVVVTVSGITASFGTAAALTQTSSTSLTFPPSTVLLSQTKVLVAFTSASSGPVYAAAATISGTTITWGAAVQVDAANAAASDLSYTSTSTATRYNPHLWLTGVNAAAIWYLDTTGLSRVAVLTESGGVVTVNTKLYGSFSTAAAGASGNGYMGAQTTTNFLTMNQVGAANGWRNLLIPHRIVGTNITYGDSQALTEMSPAVLVTAQPIVRLLQGDYLVVGANAQAIPVFRTNGDVINRRGAISLPNVAGLASFPAPAVAFNRVVLIATSQGSTINGTQVNRLLNVEIAA